MYFPIYTELKNKILKGTYTLYKYYQLIVYMFSMV